MATVPGYANSFVRNGTMKSFYIHLTGVFDSELEGEIVGTVTNGANGVVDETFFVLLSLFSEKAVRGDEHHLQGHATRRFESSAAIVSETKW